MPINACSINAFTINSLKCNSFIVLPPLPTGAGKPRSIPALVRQAPHHDEYVDVSKLEGSTIEISINLFGTIYSCVADNTTYEYEPTVFASQIKAETLDVIVTLTDLELKNV
jgi:hypothetical protein